MIPGQRKNVRKYFELSEYENTTFKKLQNAANAVIRGNFIAPNVYTRNERIKFSDPCAHLKKRGKELQIKPKENKEIIKEQKSMKKQKNQQC